MPEQNTLSRGRAFRRHHARRMKARAKRKLLEWIATDYDLTNSREWAESPRTIGMWAKSMTPCSCYMCGHERKISGPSHSERKRRGSSGKGYRGSVPGSHPCVWKQHRATHG